MYYDGQIKKILFNREQIEEACVRLGKQISEDYKGKENNLLLVGLLKGSVPFMGALIEHIDLPLHMDFMDVSSYSGTQSTGDIKIIKDLDDSIRGFDILIIEDIVDTGITISKVKSLLFSKGAKSVKICSLLNKQERREVEINADYVGFEIPNEFVVGFGLDYDQYYRNLPFVGVLDEKVYTK